MITKKIFKSVNILTGIYLVLFDNNYQSVVNYSQKKLVLTFFLQRSDVLNGFPLLMRVA